MARHRRFPDEAPPARITAAGLREAWQLFGYLWPYRGKFVAALTALLVATLFSLLFPAVTGTLVDNALTGGRPEVPAGWFADINRTALVMILVLAGQAFFAYFQSAWFAEVGERSLADLRRDAYARLIRL